MKYILPAKTNLISLSAKVVGVGWVIDAVGEGIVLGGLEPCDVDGKDDFRLKLQMLSEASDAFLAFWAFFFDDGAIVCSGASRKRGKKMKEAFGGWPVARVERALCILEPYKRLPLVFQARFLLRPLCRRKHQGRR